MVSSFLNRLLILLLCSFGILNAYAEEPLKLDTYPFYPLLEYMNRIADCDAEEQPMAIYGIADLDSAGCVTEINLASASIADSTISITKYPAPSLELFEPLKGIRIDSILTKQESEDLQWLFDTKFSPPFYFPFSEQTSSNKYWLAAMYHNGCVWFLCGGMMPENYIKNQYPIRVSMYFDKLMDRRYSIYDLTRDSEDSEWKSILNDDSYTKSINKFIRVLNKIGLRIMTTCF